MKKISRKTRKMLLMVAAMALVLGLAIGGTMAWLIDATEEVKNTFTVGDINIKLDEAVLNENGAATTARTEVGNTNIEIIPGDVVPKDPTVTVEANSESCYVFVTVENNLLLDDGTAVATLNIDTENWHKVEGAAENTATKTVYVYKNVVPATTADFPLPEVFTTVTISDTAVNKGNIQQLKNDTVIVKAYAIQYENLKVTGDLAIWNLAKAG